MRIDFICPTCSPFTDLDFEGRGIGGNEATIVLWSRELTARGHDVHVFVNGLPEQGQSKARWSPISDWDRTEPGDVLVSVRSAEYLLMRPNYATKILYLGDRMTPDVEKLTSFEVDFVWCISRFQEEIYRKLISPLIRTVVGSCGYDQSIFFEGCRTPRRQISFVHSAIPYRGLRRLLQMWPTIQNAIPDAHLHITGGYQLWGYSEIEAQKLLERDLGEVTLTDTVIYHGILPKCQLADLLRSSDIYLYPTDYNEMCCIAVLEAMACGVVPVLSNVGALKERAENGRSGVLVDEGIGGQSDLGFLGESIRLAKDASRLAEMSSEASIKARSFTERVVIDQFELEIRHALTYRN